MSGTGPIDYVVGVDPMSDNLAVIPLDVARADAALIRTLNSGTLGEVRRGDPAALALVEEAYSYFGTNPVLVDEDDPDSDVVPFDELPDSHPYDVVSWFGDDSYYFHYPLARLRTEEHAPGKSWRSSATATSAWGSSTTHRPTGWTSAIRRPSRPGCGNSATGSCTTSDCWESTSTEIPAIAAASTGRVAAPLSLEGPMVETRIGPSPDSTSTPASPPSWDG